MPSPHVGKYSCLKSSLVVPECVRQIFGDKGYKTELASVLQPLPQHSLQAYRYRIESIGATSKGKFAKDLAVFAGNF